MTAIWTKISDASLRQGDFLPRCLVPVFYPDLDPLGLHEAEVSSYDLIVATQSCDLENNKAKLVALCPIYPIKAFESANTPFGKRGVWESVRRGRFEGLHLLASPTDPTDNRQAMVVDFREIYSLPIGWLKHHAATIEHRFRLQSPFLEHFSQAFARYFMRVTLPVDIPRYLT